MPPVINTIITSVLAMIVGGALGIGVASYHFHKLMQPMTDAVKKCEANLPRNKTCRIVYTAETQ
jgi:hypothetical protein